VPGACSIAVQIVLREGHFDFTLDLIDLKAGKKTQRGEEYLKLNPKGYVPALELADRKVLTEGAIIIQYLADQRPESQLAPKNGTAERYQLQEWLHFLATELHKGYSVFYQAAATEELKAVYRPRLEARLNVLSNQLEGKQWFFGDTFTVADAYAFYCLRAYQKSVKGDLSRFPTLLGYYQRLAARPSVKASLAAEGLEP
jgi:glutathione S-transferase